VPRTPDRSPGASDEEGIILSNEGVDPAVVGEIRLNGTDLKAKDGTGVFNLRTGGSGLTEAQHKTLLQLIHFIDEGPAEGFTTGTTKTVTGTVFPTQTLWRRADATKLVEKNTTWTGVTPTTIQWKMYDTDGTTVLATVTDTIAYSGIFETGRTRAIT
jgi:hypothetical protein